MTTERRRPARERLLNAADELMFVDGVVLTPVDDILRRAGAAPATLYSNFGNKDGLIAAALERRLEDWTDAWDAAIADADSPTGRLFAIFPALRSYQRERLHERWCAFSGTAAATNRPSEGITRMSCSTRVCWPSRRRSPVRTGRRTSPTRWPSPISGRSPGCSGGTRRPPSPGESSSPGPSSAHSWGSRSSLPRSIPSRARARTKGRPERWGMSAVSALIVWSAPRPPGRADAAPR